MIRRRSQWLHSQLSREMDIMVTWLTESAFKAIIFANSHWIHYPFYESTMNSLPISRIHYEFTIFFANSPWIHYLFRVIDEVTINSLYVSRNEYWSIICFENLLWLDRFFLGIIKKHYFFAKLLWIHYLIYYQFTFACFA